MKGLVILVVSCILTSECVGGKVKRQSEGDVVLDAALVNKCRQEIDAFLLERCQNLTYSIVFGTGTRDTLAKVFDAVERFTKQKIEDLDDNIAVQYAAGNLLCQEWLNDPAKNKPVKTQGLEPCPCTKEQALVDPRFRRDPFCWSNGTFTAPRCKIVQPGADHCVLAKRPSYSTGAGQQCCYDKAGDLYTGPPGGGHMSRSHLDGNSNFPYYAVLASFYKLDVLPWLYCCKWSSEESGNCQEYYDRRPSDDCTDYNGTIPERPHGGWANDSYWAGVWGDPHLLFEVGPEENRFSICFEWFGEADEIYQYLTESSTGTQINAKFIGTPWLTEGANAKISIASGSGTAVGELGIITKEVDLHIFPDYIIIDGKIRIQPWRPIFHRWGSEEDTLVTLAVMERRKLEIIIQKGGGTIKIAVTRSGRHIDFFVENEEDLPGKLRGLMGSIIESVEDVVPQKNKPEYGELIVGKNKVRVKLIEDHGKKCWHIPYNGRDLLAAEHVQKFRMHCVLCDK